MSSRPLKETPWDKKEDRERDLGEEVGWGGGFLWRKPVCSSLQSTRRVSNATLPLAPLCVRLEKLVFN